MGTKNCKCVYFFIIINFLYLFGISSTKWVQGHLKTSKNWAFLARFCFLSLDGQFEYHLEFDADQGSPHLLLYYDDESQWPSVYHIDKTCKEKEAVLNKAGKNQIIPLIPWYPENDLSGCVMKSVEQEITTEINKNTLNNSKKSIKNKESNLNESTEDPKYYDQFLKTTITNNPILDTSENLFTNTTENISVTLYKNVLNTSKIRQINNSDIYDYLEDVENIFYSNNNDSSDIIKRNIQPLEKIKKFNVNPPRTAKTYLSTFNKKSKIIIICHNVRRFRSARERWWFIAISNCDENKGLDIKYSFLMTNGLPGDYWRQHFSADEFYVLPVLMAFCFAYMLMAMAIIMCSIELKARQMLHTTYKLYVASIAFQLFGVLLQSLAYVKYAVNGIGANNTKTVGQLLCGVSEITYLLLLILMAKGYTITRARLKISFTIQLTVFICSYSVTYTALFIYQAKAFDPGEVLYLYESPAGYGLIILRICAWFIFVYAIIFTIKKYPEKNVFYFPFSLCGTMWFYSGPLFIITANSYIDKWVRESVVIAVLLLIAFCGHISFLLLTLPVFANKNFPYHVRTTQIDVMEITGNIGGNSTVDNFSHNIYTINSNNITMQQSVIIPLTRRTEELINNVPTAPPLHALSPYHHSVFNRKDSTVNYVSNDTSILLNSNNIGPKLSISTQHSAESNISDKINTKCETSMDSLENQVIPQTHCNSILNEENSINNHTEINENLNEIKEHNKEITYKDDPEYINDMNDPFIRKASMKSKKTILQPIKQNTYNIPPPSWSLAKTYHLNRRKNEKNSSNNYNLQGVIGTFPLPQIPKKEDKIKIEESEIVENDLLNEDNIHTINQPMNDLSETTSDLFTNKIINEHIKRDDI